jgi:glycosyltransferase involved in cell wall biosynthesis
MTDPLFGTNISPAVNKKLKGFLNDNFDVVHAHHAFSRLPLATLSLAYKQNIPSVLTTHTVSFFPDYEYFWNFISYGYPRYRMVISKVNQIISVSEAAKKFISYFTQKDAVVIPNGVSIKKFYPVDPAQGYGICIQTRFIFRKFCNEFFDQILSDVFFHSRLYK